MDEVYHQGKWPSSLIFLISVTILTAVLMEKIMAGIGINKAAGGILIESLWLQLRQRRKHQVFQIYAVND